MTITNRAIKTCIDLVKDHEIGFRKDHPWRKSGLHALQHGLRVAAIAEDIAKENELPEASITMLKVCGILHDVGYIKTYNEHGYNSMIMVSDFLDKEFNKEEADLCKEIIKHHSNKSENITGNVLEHIFKDADLIDEYGVQSLMMCSNWVDHKTPFYFKALEARIGEKELAFGDKVYDMLKTEAGKTLFKRKIDFVKTLKGQLADENKGSLDYETYLTYINDDSTGKL